MEPCVVCGEHHLVKAHGQTLDRIETKIDTMTTALVGDAEGKIPGIQARLMDHERRIALLEGYEVRRFSKEQKQIETTGSRAFELFTALLPWAVIVCLFAFEYWHATLRVK